MLDSHRTPPVMASAVRGTAEVAVRAGLRYILFREVVEEEAMAIDAYLKALEPRPSPYLARDGSLTPAAERGKALFHSPETGCSACHSGQLHTDLKAHSVGTRGELDRRDSFDNPSLREVWRTGPYLHDGRAVTLRDVLTTHNKGNRHGRTSHLTDKQIDDLVAYLRSL
jgi:cytochrome c peroxidase